MVHPRLYAIGFALSILSVGLVTWHTMLSLPIWDQSDILLNGQSAPTILGRTLDLYENVAENEWAIDQISTAIAAREAAGHGSPSLRALLQAETGRGDLPPEDEVPLVRLRHRLAQAEARGRNTAPVLSEAAADALARELDAIHVVARGPQEFLADARRGLLLWLLGWLWVAACLSRRSRLDARAPGSAWALLTVVAGLTSVGLVTQAAVNGPLTGPLRVEEVGMHVAFACILGGALVLGERRVRSAIPRLPEVVSTGGLALGLAVTLTVLLWAVGRGPEASLARINLWTPLGTVQPLEAIKLLILVGVAQFVGRHQHHFLTGAVRIAGRWWPDPRLLIPFAFAAFALMLTAWVLHDIGAAMVVTVASGLLVIAIGGRASILASLLGGIGMGVAILVRIPWEAGSKIANRIAMWRDPWYNGLSGGDQVASAAWAMATGGMWGIGVKDARPEDLPAAHTDLVLPYIAEVSGLVGVFAILVAFGSVLILGFGIVARAWGERGERRLAPLAMLLLLASQVLVSTLGTVGVTPLTGIVFPFLSAGGSAAIVFIGSMIWVACAGITTPLNRTREPEIEPLHRGLVLSLLLVFVLGISILGRILQNGVVYGDQVAARPILTRTGDGELRVLQNPAMRALLSQVRRPRILDRNGNVIAETGQNGERRQPYGEALSAVLSPTAKGYTPLTGTLEAMAQEDHPVFPRRSLPVLVVERCQAEPCAGAWEPVGVVSADPAETEAQLAVFRTVPGILRTEARTATDLLDLARAVRQSGPGRAAALAEINARVPDLVTTIDADLQADVYAEMERVRMERASPASAVVVIRASTGEVLVQASGPSGDPEQFSLAAAQELSWSGPFGLLRDKASRLYLPPGSTWKAMTALAALDAGVPLGRRYTCEGHSGQGRQGSFRVRQGDQSGWVRDHGHMLAHGTPDMAGAMTVSCNVYFAQLALETGPAAMRRIARALRAHSFEVPDSGGISLATAGFGQGRTLASPLQIARGFASIASGGLLRRCELLHVQGEAARCVEERLSTEQSARQVLTLLNGGVNDTRGSGRSATPPDGATWTMVGKTGTSEQLAVPGELPSNKDHAWFAGIVTGQNKESFAVVALIARGGAGGTVAAPLVGRIAGLMERHGYLNENITGNAPVGTRSTP